MTDHIFAVLPKIAAAIGAIGKNRRTTGGALYNFRGIDAVVNKVGPIFAAHGVFLRAEILSAEYEQHKSRAGGELFSARLHLRYHFVAGDGSQVWTEAIGTGWDSGDKATNKALSIAYKYAVCQALSIPVEPGELDDADEQNYEVTPSAAPSAESKVTPAPKAASFDGAMGRGENQAPVDVLGRGAHETPTQKQLKRMFAICYKAQWTNEKIKQLLGERFGLFSSSDLSLSQLNEVIELAEERSAPGEDTLI